MSEIAKHWIDGEWTGSDTVSESVNPATGAVLGRWADGGGAKARAAVAAAPERSSHLNRRVIGIFGLCPKEPARVPRSLRR